MITWPEVLRWLALAVGIAASIAGLAWTLGRIFRPWMRNEVRAGNDALYERLKNNDFRHVEERIDATVARIDRGLQDMGDRIERVEGRRREDTAALEARIGERFDRMGGRMERMEARILAAVRKRSDGTGDPEA